MQSETIDITVREARNVPSKLFERMHVKNSRPFFVCIVYGNSIKRTQAIEGDNGVVRWGERLPGITSARLAPLKFEIYAQRSENEQSFIGRAETSIEQLLSLGEPDHTLSIGHGGSFRRAKIIHLDIYVSTSRSRPAAAGSSDKPLPKILKQSKSLSGTSRSQVAQAGTAAHTAPSSPRSAKAAVDTMRPTPYLATAIVDGTQIGSDAVNFAVSQYDTWATLLDRIKFVVDVVDKFAQIHPYASMAWAVISIIPKTIGQQMQRDAQVRELVNDLNRGFKTLQEAEDLQDRCADSDQAEIISRILQQTSECASFIKSYAKNSNFWKRLIKNVAGDSSKLVEMYRTALNNLRREFLERVAVTTKICVLQITDRIERVDVRIDYISSQVAELDATILLKDLPYGEGARFDPTKRCLPRTRIGFLDEIESWVRNPDSPRMLVLFGQAGTGKSTIASEIARRFDEGGQLLSSFVFDRSIIHPPHLPITTLAHDLSDNCAPYKRALVASIRGDVAFSLGTRDCATLFQRLLIDHLGKFDFVGNPVIVIDALDECGDEGQRTLLVAVLSESISKLPSNFRFLVTARAERDLEKAFGNASSVRIVRMDDERLGAETEDDVLRYIRSQLVEYLSDEDCQQIARIAGKLFQWASVACKFIVEPPNGRLRSECVELIMSSSVHEPQERLDKLYQDVLSLLFPTILQDAKIRFRYKTVMGLVLAPFEPLSQASLIALGRFAPQDLEITAEAIRSIVGGMGSLLSNVAMTQSSSPIVPLHTSFRDFLVLKDRSGPFFIDLADSHALLVQACLRLLLNPTEGVRFNICQLPTSYRRNDDIPDLKSRIERFIPPVLSYACRFWDDHLERVLFTEHLSSLIRALFEEKLLFWFEVLSLIGSMNLAMSALSAMQSWLPEKLSETPDLSILSALVKDSISFMRAFGSFMVHHAAHIYLSALPFCPSSSIIHKIYRNHFGRLLKVVRGQSRRWPVIQMKITATSSVESVAFSPGGDIIAYGLYDGTIGVCDATTGEPVLQPFQGHADHIRSITFSSLDHARLRIVSGSDDRTVRIWNARTGKALLDPLEGHTRGVNSVASSPDGTQIASGSDDGSIQVWNVAAEQAAKSHQLWHKGSVWSVAYSPDGACIVSGSFDRTVCIWSTKTGELIGGPFHQHTSDVKSVAFSPDNKIAISGSDDKTVLAWNVATGEIAAGPLKGHTGPIRSIAFSPKGSLIASGSWDETIRVWNLAARDGVASLLVGHSAAINDVSFSPSGDRVISGSSDRTIRVWDVATEIENTVEERSSARGNAIAFSLDGRVVAFNLGTSNWLSDMDTDGASSWPLAGQVGSMEHAAFSPDGTRLATSSRNSTVTIWDVVTGHTLLGPLQGHSRAVTVVTFSSNGAFVASGSLDGSIRVWDASTGALAVEPLQGHSESISSVTFSPDDRSIVSGSADRTVRIWDAMTGRATQEPLRGHTGWVLCVAFSRSGQCIASGSRDLTVRLWDTKTRQLIGHPCGHSSYIRSVAFSSNGRYLVSGSDDRAVRMWDAATGELVSKLHFGHTSELVSVAFSPLGDRIISGSRDGMVRVTSTSVGAQVPHIRIFEASACDEHDGWIKGPNGEYILWIPEDHRAGLLLPSIISVKGGAVTDIDYSSFVCGERWTECYTPN